MVAKLDYFFGTSTAAQAANVSTSVEVSRRTGNYDAQRQLDQKIKVSEEKIISSDSSKESVTKTRK